MMCGMRRTVPQLPSVEQRFWAGVRKDGAGGCWPWSGAIDAAGYGVFVFQHVRYRAQRVSYEIHHGPIPEGQVIDHICRVRECVNPDHLRPLTNVENVSIGVSPPAINRRRTHCHRGHPFAGDNLYVKANGWRSCRECSRIRQRKHREEHPVEPWKIPRDGSCTVDGCGHPRSRRGLCSAHYRRKLAGQAMGPVRTNISRDGACVIDGCDAARSRRGMCSRHYDRKRYAAKRAQAAP